MGFSWHTVLIDQFLKAHILRLNISMLESVNVDNFLSSNEVDQIEKLIYAQQYETHTHIGDRGRYINQSIAVNHRWKYHDGLNENIRNILDPKFIKLFGKYPKVGDSHILDSKIPYLLHTDFIHTEIENLNPEYTIIIPLDDYNSTTVIFNEYANFNDFEEFKANYSGDINLRIDPVFCKQYLSHIHPHDLKYLTIKETFPWKKGSMFAVDRRYFHCSDNFCKNGISNKRAIILWTVS